jgi:hypothetical protein
VKILKRTRANSSLILEQSGKSEEQTNEYVEKLKADKRYKRDVYLNFAIEWPFETDGCYRWAIPNRMKVY